MLGGACASLIKFLSFNHFPARSQSSTAPHAQHCYGITSGGVDSHKLCFFSNCQLDSQKEPEKGSKRAPKGLQNAPKALQKCSKRTSTCLHGKQVCDAVEVGEAGGAKQIEKGLEKYHTS